MKDQLSAEEKLQAYVNQLRTIEAYINEISARESLTLRGIMEARASIDAIRSITSAETSEVLVPLGGGVSVQSPIARPRMLLVSVGAGLTLERDPQQAIVFMEERVKELQSAAESLGSQKNEMTRQYNATRAAINSLVETKG